MDLPDKAATFMGQPVSGNVLSNAQLPPGVQAGVTSFVVQGTSQVVPTSNTPVTLSDLRTGKPMGMLTVRVDGTFTFEPVPGWIGQAPVVSFTVVGTDKQAATSALVLEVLAGEPHTHTRLDDITD